MASLPRRLLEFDVVLGRDTKTNQPLKFDESGTNATTIAGVRASVRVQNSGRPAGSSAQIEIWGLTPSLMNQLATLGMAYQIVPKNTVIVRAGDEGSALTTVFAGTIFWAYADYDSAPDVPFRMEAHALLASAVISAAPTSFPGPVNVADAMGNFAKLLGLTFENNGINLQIPASYFPGNLKQQMYALADHAGINAEVINGSILAIWPKGGARNTTTIPLIAPPPAGQMIGYPAYTNQGIIVRSLFNPQVTQGGKFKVQTSVKPVADVGTWAVNKIDLALDSLVPHGQWMMTIHAYNPAQGKPIPQAV